MKSISWKEVAQHNTSDSAWISVEGKVYDVTTWMEKHPGGKNILLISAGRDCSLLFKTYHPESSYGLLPKYYIGDLSDSELPQFAPEAQTPFYNEMKKMLVEHFKTTGKDAKNSPWIWLRYLVIVSTVLSCSYTLLANPQHSLWYGIAVSAVQGFFCALIGLMPLHDGSHFSITKNPQVWTAVMHLHDFLNGASSLIWTYQHILGHHPYTNVEGVDPDIDTAEHDVRRIKHVQPWYSHYVAQQVYAPLLYGLLAWKTRFQDISILYVLKTDGCIRVNPPSTEQAALFWGGKAFWAIYRVIIPSLLFGWPTALLYLTISDFVTSYWLALTFQVNHVTDDVAWLRPDEKGLVHADWAAAQLQTTLDYAHSSWFWTVSTGALNYQSTHHLVPYIHQFHYPAVAPLIRELGEKHGVKYIHLETFTEALVSHIGYLRTMGQDPKKGQ